MKEKDLSFTEIEELIPGAGSMFRLHKSKERFNKDSQGNLQRVARHKQTGPHTFESNADYETAEFGLVRLKHMNGDKYRLQEIHIVYSRIGERSIELTPILA